MNLYYTTTECRVGAADIPAGTRVVRVRTGTGHAYAIADVTMACDCFAGDMHRAIHYYAWLPEGVDVELRHTLP